MKSAKLLEGSAIVLAVFTVFIVENTNVSTYAPYLLALLIILSFIYISIQKRSKPASQLFSGQPLELFGIISIIIFIIALTDGLTSPLFFFLYFVLFLLAFISESITIWIFLGSIILYFLPQIIQAPDFNSFIKLGSLLLISPIAYFVGKEFERRQLLSKRIETKTDDIIQEAQLLKEDSNLKSTTESEAIDEIIEEASSLKEDSEV